MNGNGSCFNNYVNGKLATTRSFSVNFELQLGISAENKYDFSIRPAIGVNNSKSSLNSSVKNNYLTYGGWLDASVDLPGK